MLKVAIVGLPNAGKSTLFNRLVKRKKASVTSSSPGTTRDRQEGIGRISDLEFTVMDTGGWNDQTRFSLLIIEQIELAISYADVIFFLVDAKIQDDQNKELAKWLKKGTNKPVILIANKCESHKSESLTDLQYFNFTDLVHISAEHGLGMTDLYESLAGIIKDAPAQKYYGNVNSILRVAIIGRPNVGKSTFLNSLLTEKRVIVDSEPGTTRDAIDVYYNYKGTLITLIDTAGIHKKMDNLESRFFEKSVESIKRSHVIILMLNSLSGIKQQDLSIREIATREGKGIIIVLNKWDLINKNDRRKLIRSIEQHSKAEVITISALKRIGCNNVIDKCLEFGMLLNNKISTARLNKWLIHTINQHAHPMIKGKTIKMKYIAQIGTSPPAFSLVCNIPESVDESYKRYLINSLKENFFTDGIPIRLILKKNKNPYAR